MAPPGRCLQGEGGTAGSKVVASLFLSPGGPKFTSLMLHLAQHVMLQEMKTFHTGALHLAAAPGPARPVLTVCDGFHRGQLGPRGGGAARLLAPHGRQAPGADQQEVPEDRRGAGPVPPRVPEESPVSAAGVAMATP